MPQRDRLISMHRPSRRGFTLLELLVVIAIISVLIALTTAGVMRARAAAVRARCGGQMRQLVLALHLHDAQHGRFPSGCGNYAKRLPGRPGEDCGYSWQTSILPWIEQAELGRMAEHAHQLDPTGEHSTHDAVGRHVVPALICPADGRTTGFSRGAEWGVTNYIGNGGSNFHASNGVLGIGPAVKFADVTDGTSHTIAIGERVVGFNGIGSGWYSRWGRNVCPMAQVMSGGWRASPSPPLYGQSECLFDDRPLRPGVYDGPCSWDHYWSMHLPGANFGFVDGSVRFLSYSSARLIPIMSSRNGGEVVGE